MGLRIVAGSQRGKRLVTQEGKEVRPTSDRVREAIFNSLVSLDVLGAATVLDLFAGSGALGLEALSRGAHHVVFVDSSSRSLEVLRSNIEACGVQERTTIVRSDAIGYLGGEPGPFDLALLDPPYDFDRWSEVGSLLEAGIVVAESDRPVDLSGEPSDGPQRFSVLRERRYGGTVVTFANAIRRDGDGAEVPEGST